MSSRRFNFSDDDADRFDDRFGSSDGGDDDDIIMQHVRSHQEMLNRQDESLSLLGEGAARLSELSLNIAEEIKSQNKMLTVMEDDIERTEENMTYVTKKTRDLVKLAGGWDYFCVIVGLSLFLLFLIFLVIYT